MVAKLLEEAKNRGMSEAEAYTFLGKNFEVKIHKGEIDGYESSLSQGLGFRGFWGDRMGYSYTEKLSDDSVDILIRYAKENARVHDSEEKDFLYGGSPSYEKVDSYLEEFDAVTEVQKIAFAREVEDIVLKCDPRIKTCQYCVMGSGNTGIYLQNTLGLDLFHRINYGYAYVMVLAQEGMDLSSGTHFVVSNRFSDFHAERLAKEASERALAFLGAKSMKSGEYAVILGNEPMGEILGSVSGIFSARAVQKNLSLLKGKLGQQVADPCITVVDDPFLLGGSSSRAFDAEGVACVRKNVINEGILTTYLHNLKSAHQDQVASTGNASRESYKDTVGISPSNFYIRRGPHSLEDLLRKMGNGVYITEVQGLHSGFNPVSGDFSLSAKGFLVEGGLRVRAVNQITISGNILQALKNARAVADDFLLDMRGSTGSPSVLVQGLSIAGE